MSISPHLSRWLTLGGVAAALVLAAHGCAKAPALRERPASIPAQSANDRDLIPLVRIEPRYPPQAAAARQTGYVIVEFAITERGTVENPRVIEAKPKGVFDRSALEAVLRWKYGPKVVDGKAVRREGVQVRLDFRLK
jgi:TonB family protein